ncbi:hypothetical protein PHYSODRAFT_322877 [Phytophthora sojae]|uniref:Uncharacterized protein n=1 Tax=Phytophthora sojae (strain P6497) TaxID=1094619 RepID=G4YQ31_PHYSP|nr:hypothetical protein PHYSODRAFT_322877 [Phytophthora sojae]EGZ29346.1 hypothetical protein PHYSODRAFT_322877 [Phytophthora sojae]|eukprot:XP_009516621.1 hypothetical protein PHYSODRAFT_322877 [Phytophthora sojae]
MSDRGTKTGLYPLALCSAASSSAYVAKMSSPEVDQESPERLAVVLYALAAGWRCKNACIADSGKRERLQQEQEDVEEAADRVTAGAAEAAVQTEDHIPATAARRPACPRMPTALWMSRTEESMPTKVASAVTSEEVSGDATRSALLHLDAHWTSGKGATSTPMRRRSR